MKSAVSPPDKRANPLTNLFAWHGNHLTVFQLRKPMARFLPPSQLDFRLNRRKRGHP